MGRDYSSRRILARQAADLECRTSGGKLLPINHLFYHPEIA